MNRLRSHFAARAAQKPKKRLQSSIVADYRDDIISLIADDGATLTEVIEAVRAEGEPVLDAGLKAEILKQIGTVKGIRAGGAKAAIAKRADTASQAAAAPQLPPAFQSEAAIFLDEDDADFAARRPRS